MPHTNSPVAVDPAAESYPTFWDAIPVETDGPPPRPRAATQPAGDAYAAFLSAAEATQPVSLRVEQTEVG